MRHFLGLVGAIALAAAVFFGASWGYQRILRTPVVSNGLLHDAGVLYAFGALAGAGLLAGVFIAVRQVSPLAAGLPGLALIAWTVLYVVNVHRAVSYIPLRGQTYWVGFDAMLANGVLALAGLALVMPLFIPSRWRSQARYALAAAPPGRTGGAAPMSSRLVAPAGDAPTITLLTDEWSETAGYPPNDPWDGSPRQ